jgi:histidinol-phosphate aminotransferase
MAGFNARTGLEELEEYAVEHVAADIIVNANESNYNLPRPIEQAVAAKLAGFPFNRYPPETLRGLIAEDLALDADNIRIGNGSSELLQMACYAFGGNGRKIAFPYPSFSMYGVYTKLADSIAAPYPLTLTGYVDPDKVIEFCRAEQPALLIVCNPNNPTGNYNPLEVMEKILANVSCPVVMDEAYMEFAKGSGVDPQDLRPLNKLKLVAGSTLALTGKYSNFMCLRTFSKAYGLAGLRVGYAVGSAGIMRVLGKTLLPYHVNAWSLAVAEEVYRQKDLYKEQLETIIEQRDLMREQLEQMGLKIWPSATNFLTCCPQGELTARLAAACEQQYGSQGEKTQQMLAGMYLYRKLLEKKILVRDYTSHPVLQGCLRITVGLPLENAEIISQLQRLCEEEAI